MTIEQEVSRDERHFKTEGSTIIERYLLLEFLSRPALFFGRRINFENFLNYSVKLSKNFKNTICHNLAIEEASGTRFLFNTFAAGSGAVFYFRLSFEPLWAQIIAVATLLVCFIILSRNYRILSMTTLCLLWVAIGFACAKLEDCRMRTPIIGSELSTTITARILSIERQAQGGYRLSVAIISTERPKLTFPIVNVRLSSRTMPEDAKLGDVIKGFVHLRPPSGPVRPDNYDFAFYSYFQGISAQGFFLGHPEISKDIKPASWRQNAAIMIAGLRAAMTRRIIDVIGGEEGAIAAALITGQRGSITYETNNALRVSGLAHILSISGLHMAMVSGMILIVVRTFLALFPVFSSKYASKKIAAIIALTIAAFYLMLSGADVAAQRSFVMVAVMLIAILFDRSAITMRNLAVAALVTIAISPHEVLGPSFQMSFSATAALVAVFGWWSARNQREKQKSKISQNKFIRWTVVPLLSTAAASLVAGFSSGIYAAFHFSNAAPLGILSNALAFPVMSIAVMPFALLGALLMPVGLERFPLAIMGYGVKLVQKIALWITAISPDIHPSRITLPTLAVLTIGLALLLIMRTKLRLIGVPVMLAGLTLYVSEVNPIIIIAQDGKLVAAIFDDELAINQNSIKAFTVNNWRTAYGSKIVSIPTKHEVKAEQGELTPNFSEKLTRSEHRFLCDLYRCQINLRDGRILTINNIEEKGTSFCDQSDVIYLNCFYATNRCKRSNRLIITRRDLALYGSAEVFADNKINWSSGIPERSWNIHRKFARDVLLSASK